MTLGNDGRPPDLVGIGALNLDRIAHAAAMREGRGAALRHAAAGTAERAGVPLRAGGEAWVGAATMRELLAAADVVTPTTAVLGGSAFNAVRAAAQTQTGLRLGYVGVAGRSPVAGVDVPSEMEALGVDTRFVHRAPEELCGVCFSYAEEDGERTLLTHAGANSGMAAHLTASFEPLVRYLAAARIVHVTCFVDAFETADLLGRLLAAVRRTGSAVRVSLDPGHGWSTDPGPAVRRLLAVSDQLLVNRQEFRDLGRAYGCEGTEGEAAAALLSRLVGRTPLIVVKRPDGVDLHRRGEGGAAVRTAVRQEPLLPGEIEDATGAGDVFAGGLLAVLARGGPGQAETGCRLGVAMARRKLCHVGGQDIGYGRLARRLLGPGEDRPPPG